MRDKGGSFGRSNLPSVSSGKAEVQHVAVGDDVVLAFQAQLAGVARAGLAAERHVTRTADRLGANEALLEIRVNGACRLRRPGAFGQRPGVGELRPDGEE